MNKTQNDHRIDLEWTKLLGFDLASGEKDPAHAAGLADPRLLKLGSKISTKPSG